MAHLPLTLGSEGLQVQKGAHRGQSIAVFTSGGDSQGTIISSSIVIILLHLLYTVIVLRSCVTNGQISIMDKGDVIRMISDMQLPVSRLCCVDITLW